MHEFIKRHKQRFLLVIGLVMAVSLVLPSFFGSKASSGANPVIGVMGIDGTKIHMNEARDSANLLGYLTLAGPGLEENGKRYVLIPRGARSVNAGSVVFPVEDLYNHLSTNKDIIPILIAEARRLGIRTTEAQIDQVIAQLAVPAAAVTEADVMMGGAIGVTVDKGLKPADIRSLRAAIAQSLEIRDAFNRMSSASVVSDAEVDQFVAVGHQNVRIRILELRADDYKAGIESPAEAEVFKHFDAYNNADRRDTVANNRFAISYRTEPRLSLQYISIPIEEVRKVVLSRRKDIEWERMALRRYNENFAQYADSDGRPTTFPSTRPARATRPTYDHFDTVRKVVMEDLTRQDIIALMDIVRGEIRAVIREDESAFRAYKEAKTPPATQPVSTLGVPFDSLEYFQRLAAKIEASHKVRVYVNSLDKPQSAEELIRANPWMGSVRANVDPGSRDDQKFIQLLSPEQQLLLREAFDQFTKLQQDYRNYAFGRQMLDRAYKAVQTRAAIGMLDYFFNWTEGLTAPGKTAVQKLWIPAAVPFIDDAETVYQFRVTAIDPPKPGTLQFGARMQVDADMKMIEAFRRAAVEAQTFAVHTQPDGLKSAAGSRLTFVSRPLEADAVTIDGWDRSYESLQTMLSTIKTLRQQAADLAIAGKSPTPIAIVELPRDRVVAVVQLEEIIPDWTSAQQLENLRRRTRQALVVQQQRRLLAQWFDPQNVRDRNKYKRAEEDSSPRPNAPPMPTPLGS